MLSGVFVGHESNWNHFVEEGYQGPSHAHAAFCREMLPGVILLRSPVFADEGGQECLHNVSLRACKI